MYVGYLWKALGTVAKVYFGQVTTSIHTKLKNKEHVIETLLETKFKFPGCQRIYISNKWGFIKVNAKEFEDMVAEKGAHPRWLRNQIHSQ